MLGGEGRFEVVGRLGAGGMGVVYEVIDRQRQARMALKTLRVTEAGTIVRLKREFRALQDLQHPNLVVLGELIEQDGNWCFTMELVPGVDFLAHVRPGRAAVVGSDSLEMGRTVQSIEELPRNAVGAPLRRPAPVDSGTIDVERLRPALAQLASGLAALHGARMVHRDVKPGNVRVTPEGRVVLLDFGLVAEAQRSSADVLSDPHVVGTAAYMAPEQAAAQRVGASADWYSVGVMLYEALTGRLPFVGPPLEQLLLKQRQEPKPPSSVVPDVPADLDRLCTQLLRRDPVERPRGAEVLATLGVALPAASAAHSSAPSSGSYDPPFLGREAELATLDAAFADTRAGQTVTVLIGGRSGVGKSALVQRALARAREAVPGLTLLAGRCHERESVPYKAFDGIADALATHLTALPHEIVRTLVPRGAELLAHVFPQLTSVEEIARAARTSVRAADPLEQRRQLFAALRDLLDGLSVHAPVCLAIDDLQWADADSRALLSALLTPPDAPALLLLATLRDESPDAGPVSLPGDVRRLDVLPLPRGEARALAERLLKLAGAPPNAAAAIAEEAGGHPLFIDELARRAASGGVDTPGALRLDDALWERAERLDPGARALLELIVLAGGPLRQSTAQRAAGGEGAVFLRQLGELRVARFCRTSGGRASDTVEPWHDRVRESTAARLSPERAAAGHERLALALEGEPTPDPEALTMHWRLAGKPEHAAGYALAAGRRAATALAFERAAHHFRSALDLGAPAGVGLESLHSALGDALAASGRGAEAADAYLAAAAGAQRADDIELRRRAAELRLKIGDFDAGLALLRGVVEPLGMSLPGTPRRALVALLLGRARLALRGLGFRARDPSQVSAEELTRVDLCWSAAIGLGMCEFILGADFQTRHLRLALAAGEPYRVARALCVEACYVSAGGERARAKVEAVLDRASALAVEVGNLHAIGLSNAARGLCAFQMGDFRGALESWPASEWLRGHCTGVEWEASLAQYYSMMALAYLGRYGELGARFPPVLAENERRGDRFAETFMRLAVFHAWLVADAPDEADRQVEQAITGWSRQGFHIQHYLALLASGQIALYRGDDGTDGARARVEAAWPALERSLLMQVSFNRWTMLDLRARSQLAWARAQPDGKPKRRALAAAVRHVAPLARAPEAYARGMALAVRASAAEQSGARADALEGYHAAARLFAEREMRGHVAAMHWRAAALGDSPECVANGDRALAFARDEGIVRPARFLKVLAP